MVAPERTIQATNQRYTSEQFHDLVRFFDAAYQYELRQGVIYKMAPSNMVPSKIALRISFYLSAYLVENDIGHLTGADGAYILSDEDTFAPDVGFISYAHLPHDVETGFIPFAPDVAVEVVSPSDDLEDVRSKAQKYLAHGTALVWIVIPESQTVEVYQPEQNVRVFADGDTLGGEAVLPGFTLDVRAIFAVQKRRPNQE